MSFATLMVQVDLYDASDARLRLAGDLCDRFNSVLIGIAGCAPVPAPIEGGYPAGQIVTDQVQDIASRLEKRGEEFRLVGGTHRWRVEWRSEIGFPIKVIVQEARAADLVIIGRDRRLGAPINRWTPAVRFCRSADPCWSCQPVSIRCGRNML